jgi:hypothetical protein
MQLDAWYKTWYMRGILYANFTLQNSCSLGYLLPSLQTFHSTTTEKAFAYSRMLPYMRSRGTWYNKKYDAVKQLYYPA